MTAYYTPLRDDALLACDGPDAATFLQGQVTCDISRLDSESALPGALCNLQGRVIADFLAFGQQPQGIGLRLRRDLLTRVRETLAKYIVFSRATIGPAEDGWRLFGCWGETCAQRLQALFGPLPGARHGVAHRDGTVLLQTDSEGQAFECYAPPPQAAQCEAELAGALEAGTLQDWDLHRIHRGEARIGAALSETEPPQAFDFDHSGHLSFNKGCYTGQEVVARLHYRGRSKWRLYRATLPREYPEGTELAAAGGGRTAARVVTCAADGSGAAQCLLIATAQAASPGLEVDGQVVAAEALRARQNDA